MDPATVQKYGEYVREHPDEAGLVNSSTHYFFGTNGRWGKVTQIPEQISDKRPNVFTSDGKPYGGFTYVESPLLAGETEFVSAVIGYVKKQSIQHLGKA